jgi:hypothetical protein
VLGAHLLKQLYVTRLFQSSVDDENDPPSRWKAARGHGAAASSHTSAARAGSSERQLRNALAPAEDGSSDAGQAQRHLSGDFADEVCFTAAGKSIFEF